MAPASRIALRLADLSHAQLLEIAAAGCEASTEVKNRADTILAAHKPLAQRAVEGVLLSSDLLPHLLAPLQLQDGAAAAVCSQWADSWKATSEGRRRLKRVAFDFPQDLLGTDSLGMAVIPGGDEQQLVVRSSTTVRILARDMSSGASFEVPSGYGDFAASEQFLYMATGDRLCCLTHAGWLTPAGKQSSLAAARTTSLWGAHSTGSARCNAPLPFRAPKPNSLAAC